MMPSYPPPSPAPQCVLDPYPGPIWSWPRWYSMFPLLRNSNYSPYEQTHQQPNATRSQPDISRPQERDPYYGSMAFYGWASSLDMMAGNNASFAQQNISSSRHKTFIRISSKDKDNNRLPEKTEFYSKATANLPEKPSHNGGENMNHELHTTKTNKVNGAKPPGFLSLVKVAPTVDLAPRIVFQDGRTSGSKNGSSDMTQSLSVGEGGSSVSPAPTVAQTAAMMAVTGLWVGPLVVVYWCNTWHIIERYIFPEKLALSCWISAIIGFLIFIIASSLQGQIYAAISSIESCYLRHFLSRVYTYIMAAACVFQWRGIWALEDFYMGVSERNATLTTVVALCLLLLLRCLRNAIAPPVMSRPDSPLEGYFTMTTFFYTTPGTVHQVWDSALTIVVVATMVVTFWRSSWELMDLTLFPDNMTRSALVTLAASYTLFLILSLCQSKASKLSLRLDSIHWFLKLIFEDVYLFLQVSTAVTHYRGFWVLLDEHDIFRPASLWVCHGVSFLLLTLTLASQNLVVCGCARDGELTNGDGVRLNPFYLTLLRRSCDCNCRNQRVSRS